jgi:proton-translocating NADH-quinone oxidoreductase chain N
VGFLFKITAVPFHMWSPDVYEGAPTPVTAFFIIVPKAALFGVFLRIFLESFYDFLFPWQKILLVSSNCSMLLGSLAALSQTRIKRLLAYSSIGHVGYLLAGFACGTIEGIQALLIYLFVYVFMNINMFAFILCGMRRETLQTVPRIKFITDLSFLSKTNPLLALTFTITLFSMAGIPPLAGFYSKAFLFFAAMSSNLYVLAVIGVLCSVLSCFYYIRLVKIMYFEGNKNWCSFSLVPVENAITLAITLFFILFFMFYPTPLHLITHKIALTLCL